ncbi:spp-3 [Pristionchus pacificus]|uniref:Saposin B-type domain-containing protein n=1 Tax=Pristionchus pacificus TaxID=54126 RepID=A0A2A6D1T0_PRIPA|nr:spp-3 [Pristionchus pacificus]|eukprot:PDM84404.1 hypothetical protein PRIPAC_33427 [Pristionchus pacificus]
MARVLIILFLYIAVTTATNESETSPTPAFPQAKDLKIRSLFCKSCMIIVGAMNDVVSEDSFRKKQVIEDKCNGQFGLSSPAGMACSQWLDGELENIQNKLKNGWSPSTICSQFKLCN